MGKTRRATNRLDYVDANNNQAFDHDLGESPDRHQLGYNLQNSMLVPKRKRRGRKKQPVSHHWTSGQSLPNDWTDIDTTVVARHHAQWH